MLKMVETFSGIGAQAKALKNINVAHEILNTADWDVNAIIAYDIIHNGKIDDANYKNMSKKELLDKLSNFTLSLDGKKPATKQLINKLNVEILRKLCSAIDRTHNLISVTDIQGKDLPDDMNILTYSFPCQDLSIAGFWHGNKGGIDRGANNRSSMLWQIERILLERKKQNLSMPRFLLMENVRNITSHQHIENFREWQKSLEDMGYKNYEFKLNACNFGIPQTRVRIYMVSVYTNHNEELEAIIKKYFDTHDLNDLNYVKKLNIIRKNINDILKLDYTNFQYKNEANSSQPNDTKSRKEIFKKNCIIYDGEKIIRDVIPTITTKQDRHPNSGLIVYKQNLKKGKSEYRYLTPRESFMFMGFDESDYQLLSDNNFNRKKNTLFFSRDKINKMAGNSIVVNVLEEIFKQIDYINNHFFEL